MYVLKNANGIVCGCQSLMAILAYTEYAAIRFSTFPLKLVKERILFLLQVDSNNSNGCSDSY